ncbi:MAG: polymer-forming cytoskeletal protein [Oscillospiraceae bacterium]|jgi:cytoskeletal protein CcmA (bactofilin family)|nr:polymer-forming cytoskeletal protein [Oscillospiraceae bacterium]
MRTKNALPAAENAASPTVIGKGIKLEAAKLSGTESVIIDGIYLGDVDLDGFLKIGETGSVIGNIKAKQIEIAGKVKGVVVCDGTVHLTASAYVEGGIATQSLKTDEGARINGQCRMVNDQTETLTLELLETEGKLNFNFSELSDAFIPDKGLPISPF